MNAARILDCSEEQYHADPCERPSLSASIATTLVTRSPLHAWSEHPRLGGLGKTATREMDRGTLIHRLVLGAGRDWHVIDADDYRTKGAREERDAARERGLVPVLRDELDAAQATASAILARLGDHGLSLGGESEVKTAWEEQSRSGTVLCRGMLDHLDGARIIDLKTTARADPDTFERAMVSRGHDIQYTAYLSALESLRPELVGRAEMLFVVAETEPPHALLIGSPAGDMIELGARRWRRAVEVWGRCLAADDWPGYPTRIHDLHAPAWVLQREEFAT